MSLIVDLATAVETRINAGTYSAPYAGLTATRRYRPEDPREDLETLTVSVVAAGKESEIASRGSSTADDLTVFVGIAKGCDFKTTTEPDGLNELVEEIENQIATEPTQARCVLQRISYATPESIYSREASENHDIFYSVMALTYRAKTVRS